MNKKIYEKINCPICGVNDYKVLRQNKFTESTNTNSSLEYFNSSSNHKLTQQLVKCSECGLVYVNPRFSSNIINSGYSYNEDKKFITQDNERIESFKINLKNILNLLSLTKKRLSILDVGSAGGAFLESVDKKYIYCDGIEPNKWLVKKAKENYKNINIFSNTINNYKSEKKYDLITYWDVFEHLTDINKEMYYIKKLLKINSFLILNIPDYGSIHRKVLGYNWPFYLDVHLYYFNKKTLLRFMDDNNFEFIGSIKHIQILKLGYISERITNIFPFMKFLTKIIELLKISDKKISYNVGQNIYIFKKNV